MVRKNTTHLRKAVTMKANEFLPLSEEEMLFLWKGLVDEGKLSPAKLQVFMHQVAGVKLTPVQVQDLLGYMDANSDGRVGMEDFKNFLSVGRLAETDAKSFMWEPKAKFQRENPHSRVHTVDSAERQPSAGSEPHLERRQSGRANSDAPELKPIVAPESKAPLKRRPQQRKTSSCPETELVEGTSTGPTFKTKKPPKLSAEAEAKIQNALLKYEDQSWDKFVRDEKIFRRYLFEQFAGAGEDEMDVTEYHRMLMKWFPLAAWSAPRALRAADSLAALEYVRRKDLEDRGVSYEPVQPEAIISQNTEALLPRTEAKMSYGLWLDVMNGKHCPEEHLTDYRHHQAQV
mmetsp:Transcript_28155/g.44024  ORF Transcript_28155/g.44024 Transcript_28155/m.44024 type:complete len:345 (-) Transcript_28155:16-1050(-)